MNLNGRKIAIAGMGRSGFAIAKAAQKRGAKVTVYDEHAADTDERMVAVEQLQGLGVQVVTGWHGRLNDESFDILVASPGFKREHPAIRDALHLGKEVISEVEFAYRINNAPIVAITGTNGKSTTTVMTWLILKGAGTDAVLCGNLSGSGYPELTLTEAADASQENQVLVAEVSSYQLEWVTEFRPKVATITNITPDHLDRHPSFEDYRDTKFRLFSKMGEGDIVVINEHEPSLHPEVLEPAIPREVALRLFSSSAEQTYGLEQGQFTENSTRRQDDTLILSGRGVKISDLPFFGEHNFTNAMQAWELAASILGSAESDRFEGMLKGLMGFVGLQNRMERLGEKAGVLVVNNSMCTNPAAVIVSSSSLPMRQHILMGGLTKNLDFSNVRDYLESAGHTAYLFGAESSDPGPEALGNQLGKKWKEFPTLESAFTAAAYDARPGEAILLAPGCLSAYPFANFRERGDAFRAIAGEWLKS